MFSRENRRPKRAKFKIYLSFEGARASVVALLCWRWSCPLGAGGQALGACPLLWPCVPCLSSAFLLCARCVACKYALVWRFKGVFRGFYGVRVGLCCSCALRGLWGFCTRVELGGLEACGVFAPRFILFAPMFPLLCLSLSLFALVVFACPPALSLLSWFVFVVSFSLSDYTQKERALRVGASSLVLLQVVCLLCKIWLPILVKFVIVSLNLFGDTFV